MGILSKPGFQAFLTISALIWLSWTVGWIVAQPPKEDIGLEVPEWVIIRHESGVSYMFRRTAVIGFIQPVPGDPRKRNGILLSNGHTLNTTIPIDEFEEFVRIAGDSTKSFKE